MKLGRLLLVRNRIGQRGKKAEAAVKKLFQELKERHRGFDYIKLKDARSSRGKGASKQVADFQVFTDPHHIAVEVKEINHISRLPQKNLTQIPKMQRRAMAGGETCILVYSLMTDSWTYAELAWVVARKSKPSYDLSDLDWFDTAGEAWGSFCSWNNIKY